MVGWVKYSLLGFGLAFIVVAVLNLFWTVERLTAPGAFRVVGESADRGTFDPSIAFDPDTGRGYMAYAAISGPTPETPFPPVAINLAHSHNQGERWVYQTEIFRARSDDLVTDTARNLTVSGIWRYEMPTLVHTPEDTGREWKIYAYRYFWADDVELARETGVIVYKDSSNPRQGWSEEKWMFSANQFNPPPPYNNLVLLHLNVLDPDLSDINSYADPGAYTKEDVLYLTLSAYETIQRSSRIVMIASSDFGQSWTYIDNVLTAEDISELGYTRMSGGQIIEYRGEDYFLVALGDELQNAQGTFVLKFKDLATGALERDRRGRPVIYKHFSLDEQASPSFGGGQADYHEQNAGGLLMPVMLRGNIAQPFVILGQGHSLHK